MCANCADDRAAVADALRRARRIVLTTHVRPDGDALGSVTALYVSAGLAGKNCQMVIPDAIPRRYAFLLEQHSPSPAERFAELAGAADLIVVLDTCAFAQLTPMAQALKQHRRKVAVIDHHATGDDVGSAVWRDESAAAVGVMLLELLGELGWPFDVVAAEALMTAICADTGWFRYANTDARALNAARMLATAGVRLDELHGRLYQSDRPQRVRLFGAALGSLELHADDRLALVTLTQEDFARTGAAAEETEDLASEPLRIASVEIAALLVEQPDGQARVSLRSRRVADVARIAAGFGGGGHARAAGFRADAGIAAVKQRLIAACGEAIQQARLDG